MEYKSIALLTQVNAEQIAREWHYDGQYAFYDMENDLEDFTEIITPNLRSDNYFQMTDENDELLAFFCLEKISEEKVEVGLGLRPNLTGHGLGLGFIKTIESFVNENFDYQEMLLSVADFNERAIKVYQKTGFKKIGTTIQSSNGGLYRFINLIKRLDGEANH